MLVGRSTWSAVVALFASFAGVVHGATNAPPTISGTPATEVTVGQTYAFRPTASDPEGVKLRYSIAGKPVWASFNTWTGKLTGTPQDAHVGTYENVKISVSDKVNVVSLAPFSVTVLPLVPPEPSTPPDPSRKANYGHYFATRYVDTPADAAMLCEQAGVTGIVWRQTWAEVESSAGSYDFSSFDKVLAALSASKNTGCQLFLFIEFKSFSSSPVKNPCPAYLQPQYSATNDAGAYSCFMWEPVVVQAYAAMMRAAAARYDANPRVEGLVLQESALGFGGTNSQDVSAGGSYTPEAWRDALVQLVRQCGDAFQSGRCVSFLNFIRHGQQYLSTVASAIAAVPGNRACLSGPDLLPDEQALYATNSSVYEVMVRHAGCRSNSAQNNSYAVTDCDMGCIFRFGVGGTFGDFPETAPRTGGVCINSYLFWTHRVHVSRTGLDWTSALPVIAANPYGPAWLDQCAGGGGPP